MTVINMPWEQELRTEYAEPEQRTKKEPGSGRLMDLVKLARPRTWFFIVFSFVIGWLLSGAALSGRFFVGLTISLIGVVNVNLLNAYTDQEEDHVNLPHRVAMLDRVGERNLIAVIAALYGVATLLAVVMPFWYKVVYVVSAFDAIFYSLPPLRLKGGPISSLVSFAGAVFLPAVGAWTLEYDLMSTPSVIFFLGYVFLTYCTLKNIPDYDGDKLAGLRTSATIFSSKKTASYAATALLLSPYPLLVGLTSLGIMEAKFNLLLWLLPVIGYISRGVINAETYEEHEKFHTLGLVYMVAFLVSTLLIISPTLRTLGLITGLLAMQSIILKAKIDSR
jgi:4-hydroxybenzoate polyprenyltransferase